MEKLKQGDYVTNLTKKQFDELIEIEGDGIVFTFIAGLTNNLYVKRYFFSGDALLSCIKPRSPIQELPFEVFKERAINTFKK